MASFADEIALHRSMLVRIARRRLRNDAWAEDAASETVMAALDKPGSYAGRATVRTWLVGILVHKVADQVRRHRREIQIDAFDPDLEACDASELTGVGMSEARATVTDPVDCLMRRQFVEHLERCMEALPPKQARAVLLRDCFEERTEDICDELGVTSNNLAVILHRARGTLRASLRMHCGVAVP